jgi:hypothetical protein
MAIPCCGSGALIVVSAEKARAGMVSKASDVKNDIRYRAVRMLVIGLAYSGYRTGVPIS